MDELLSPGSSISQVSDRRASTSRLMPVIGQQRQQQQQQGYQTWAISEAFSEAPSCSSQQGSERLRDHLDAAQGADNNAALLAIASGGPVDVSALWARDVSSASNSSGTRDSFMSQGSLLEGAARLLCSGDTSIWLHVIYAAVAKLGHMKCYATPWDAFLECSCNCTCTVHSVAWWC
jgi:hypothetical protein